MLQSISRRQAARLISATAASALLPIGTASLFGADDSARLILRPLPSGAEKLPVIGLGTALTFDVANGSPAARTVAQVLALFVRRGGTSSYTSPAYGNAESLVGDLAYKAGLTKSLFIATKVWTRSRPGGRRTDGTLAPAFP